MRLITKIGGLFLLFVLSCGSEAGTTRMEQTTAVQNNGPETYAQGFTVVDKGTHRELVFIETAQNVEFARYFLVDRNDPVPEGLDTNYVIHTPVRSVVCASTTHASFFSELGRTDVLSGIAYPNKVMDNAVVKAIEASDLADVTGSSDVDIEKVIALDPDLVIIYPSMANVVEKLWEANIPVMLFAEHSEPHPLGRAEWLKVIGALLNEEKNAEQKFQKIRSRYEEMKERVPAGAAKPLVFFGSAWKGVWHAPGGRSASAQLLRDAGAEYLFRNNESVRNMQVDFEVLLDKGYNADYWGMVVGGDPSTFMEEMERNDPRMMILRPVQEKAVFYCNSEEADYFGRAVVEPDVLLADLLHIFHPNSFPNHVPVYFRMIEK